MVDAQTRKFRILFLKQTLKFYQSCYFRFLNYFYYYLIKLKLN